MNTFTKQKQTHRHREQIYITKGERWGRRYNLGDLDYIHTLLCVTQIINKDLLFSTGNSTQYSVIIYMGKESEKNRYTYMYSQVCLVAQIVKNLPVTENLGLIPGSGRSLGERNGYPVQYSCLEISMNRGAWQAPLWGLKKLDTTQETNTHTCTHTYLCIMETNTTL